MVSRGSSKATISKEIESVLVFSKQKSKILELHIFCIYSSTYLMVNGSHNNTDITMKGLFIFAIIHCSS